MANRTWTTRELPQVLTAGFVATLVMTLLMAPVATFGQLPIVDFPALLGSLLTGRPVDPFEGAWWAGLATHFFLGAILFPTVFAYLIYDLLPGQVMFKGALWGVFLFAIWETIIMPMTGYGIFGRLTPQPIYQAFVALNGHLIYGATLGIMVSRSVRHAFGYYNEELDRREQDAA